MIGQMVGNYEITGELGEGGMGQVFSAVNRQYNRRVALKLLLPQFSSNQEVVTRFFNEARAAGAIHHPGIVDVYECGFDQAGRAFIAMDYLQGETLTARLARYGRMPADHVGAIGRMMAEALAAAHARGIIHRDLKPDNAMIVWDGQYERVKLLDFGLAKLQGDLASPDLRTRTGTFMGTPVYMSPEQCLGAGNVDARSDVYSLGCVLYELACGRPPFSGDEYGQLVAAHLREAPTPPSQIAPSIPARLERLILRLIEKQPDDRYQTMSQVASAFAAISAMQTLPPVSSPAETGPRPALAPGSGQPQPQPQPAPAPRRRDIGPTPIPELPRPQRLWIPVVVLLAVTCGLVAILVSLLR